MPAHLAIGDRPITDLGVVPLASSPGGASDCAIARRRSYLRYVRTASNGCLSVEVPLASGVEVSVRTVARDDRSEG